MTNHVAKPMRVVRIQDLTPHFRRIVLSGADFSMHRQGDHVKLLIPNGAAVTRRIYTIAHYDNARQELSIDFVLHGDNGPASKWASRAVIGDSIDIIAPRGSERFVVDADWYVLMSDLSGLAALNAVLAALPVDAIGYALIEVESHADIQGLNAPKGIKVQWLVRPQSERAAQSRLILNALKNITWHAGNPSITLAAENEQVILIRKYLRLDKNLSYDMMYAIPYWKDNCSEEKYHEQRHEAMADVY